MSEPTVTISVADFDYLMKLARFGVEQAIRPPMQKIRTRHLDGIEREAVRS